MVSKSTKGFNGVTISEITLKVSPRKLSKTEPTSRVRLCKITSGSPISKLLSPNNDRVAFSSCEYSITVFTEGNKSPTEVATWPYKLAAALALALRSTPISSPISKRPSPFPSVISTPKCPERPVNPPLVILVSSPLKVALLVISIAKKPKVPLTVLAPPGESSLAKLA